VPVGKPVLAQQVTYEHDSLGAHLAASEVGSDTLFLLTFQADPKTIATGD
jgi:hypothetical protein